jgi:hypothetical protein
MGNKEILVILSNILEQLLQGNKTEVLKKDYEKIIKELFAEKL